jgi:hypothetical protein
MEYKYNRLGEVKEVKDQLGTIRVLEYDKLGKPQHDRVTTLGSNVDGAVRRITRTYEVRGMLEKLTSYDNATVGSGNMSKLFRNVPLRTREIMSPFLFWCRYGSQRVDCR